MDEKITSSLNSISFVNHLAINKRAEIGNIVIEVEGNFSIQDALIVKNILLLLNQAKKLDYVSRPLHIAGWVTIYNKDNAPKPEPIPEDKNRGYLKKLKKRNEADDVLDALRYSLCDVPEEKSEPSKSLKSITGDTVSLSDIHLALDTGDKVDRFVESCFMVENDKPKKLPGGVPVEFLEDYHNRNNKVLAKKYKKGEATIRRWKRVIREGGFDDESSQ